MGSICSQPLSRVQYSISKYSPLLSYKEIFFKNISPRFFSSSPLCPPRASTICFLDLQLLYLLFLERFAWLQVTNPKCEWFKPHGHLSSYLVDIFHLFIKKLEDGGPRVGSVAQQYLLGLRLLCPPFALPFSVCRLVAS